MRRAKVILLLFVMQLSFNLNAQQPTIARSSTMKLQLPEQVPYLNPIRPKQIQYCIGNSVLAALAEPSGQWNALIGPGYGAGKGWTEKEVVLSETLQLVIDGYKNHKVIITFTDLATTSSPDAEILAKIRGLNDLELASGSIAAWKRV